MSFEVNTDSNRNQFFTKAIPCGVALTATDIAMYALEKENRADTFVGTAKKSAKAFTNDGKIISKWILDKFKWNKGVDFINKLSNRKMFAGTFGAAVLLNAIFINAVGKMFNRK